MALLCCTVPLSALLCLPPDLQNCLVFHWEGRVHNVGQQIRASCWLHIAWHTHTCTQTSWIFKCSCSELVGCLKTRPQKAITQSNTEELSQRPNSVFKDIYIWFCGVHLITVTTGVPVNHVLIYYHVVIEITSEFWTLSFLFQGIGNFPNKEVQSLMKPPISYAHHIHVTVTLQAWLHLLHNTLKNKIHVDCRDYCCIMLSLWCICGNFLNLMPQCKRGSTFISDPVAHGQLTFVQLRWCTVRLCLSGSNYKLINVLSDSSRATKYA